MKVTTDVLAARLEEALGSRAVESDPLTLGPYVVDGKCPSIRCLPHEPEQVSTALRTCAEANASVIPWGGGTFIGMGNIPRQVDVVIGLERLCKLVEHDDANLTATVQAGMTAAMLQEILGRRRQFLAIDPPHPTRATIGGLVAVNSNGPRRMLYGGVRDLVVGMKMVLACGTPIKAGGKVVKNVAGYDMCKLFVGSFGTLGIITEATFKMAPIPESAATVVARGPLVKTMQLGEEVMRSTLLPAAIAILNGEAAQAVGAGLGMPAVAVWAEGFEQAVTRHLRDLQAIAERIGLSAEILHNEPHQRLWEYVRDFGTNGEDVLYRITVPLAAVAEVLAKVDRWSESGHRARTIAHAGTGTVWVQLDADPSSLGSVPRLTALAQEHKGHAVLVAAPPALKEGVDVWGPSPPSLAIMREIKRQFDPQGILNPGRFLAGL
jgi:glycolate oxidase FAD binding subunit